jgi:hypothetical protein
LFGEEFQIVPNLRPVRVSAAIQVITKDPKSCINKCVERRIPDIEGHGKAMYQYNRRRVLRPSQFIVNYPILQLYKPTRQHRSNLIIECDSLSKQRYTTAKIHTKVATDPPRILNHLLDFMGSLLASRKKQSAIP